MIINENTRISALIRENPSSIEAIASLSRHFEKLRNPVLRKLLAHRVTIGEAARIGKCSTDDFFSKLEPLGFVREKKNEPSPRLVYCAKPELRNRQVVELDVRPLLAAGTDPFSRIMEVISTLKKDEVLALINTFEPLPLIRVMERKGYCASVERSNDAVITYFDRVNLASGKHDQQDGPNDLEGLYKRYSGKIRSIDVRNLEMPKPMMVILGELDALPAGYALFVHHKKVPQFLLPELAERGLTWSIDERGPQDVKLIICK